jgi:hypothetical protein
MWSKMRIAGGGYMVVVDRSVQMDFVIVAGYDVICVAISSVDIAVSVAVALSTRAEATDEHIWVTRNACLAARVAVRNGIRIVARLRIMRET